MQKRFLQFTIFARTACLYAVHKAVRRDQSIQMARAICAKKNCIRSNSSGYPCKKKLQK